MPLLELPRVSSCPHSHSTVFQEELCLERDLRQVDGDRLLALTPESDSLPLLSPQGKKGNPGLAASAHLLTSPIGSKWYCPVAPPTPHLLQRPVQQTVLKPSMNTAATKIGLPCACLSRMLRVSAPCQACSQGSKPRLLPASIQPDWILQCWAHTALSQGLLT